MKSKKPYQEKAADWVAIRCRPGSEKAVRQEVLDRLVLEGLESKIQDVLAPGVEVLIQIRNGRRHSQEREKPIGYVVLKVVLDEAVHRCLSQAPGVEAIISPAGEAQRVVNDALGFDLQKWPELRIEFQRFRSRR